jgi:hypothetical protein
MCCLATIATTINPCNLRHHSFIHQIGTNFSTRRIYERCYLVNDPRRQSHVGSKMLLYSWSKTRNYVIPQQQVNIKNHSKLKVFAQTKGMINIKHWFGGSLGGGLHPIYPIFLPFDTNSNTFFQIEEPSTVVQKLDLVPCTHSLMLEILWVQNSTKN